MTIAFYNEKIVHNHTLIRRLRQVVRLLIAAKLLTFTLFGLSLYGWIVLGGNLYTATSIAALVLYVVAYRLGIRYDERLELRRKVAQCYEQEIDYLSRNFSSFDSGERFVDPSHEYSFDLDLFGRDSFFQRINRTTTRLGAEHLAQWLGRIPETPTDVIERQAAIEELAPMEEWRTLFRAVGQGSDLNVEQSIETLQTDRLPSVFDSRPVVILMSISAVATVSLLVLTLMGKVPGQFFGLLFALQLGLCLLFYKRLSVTGEKIGGLHKAFRRSWQLLRLVQETSFSATINQRLQQSLVSERPNAVEALRNLSHLLEQLDARSNALGTVLLDGLLLRDLFLMRRYNQWKRDNQSHLFRWLRQLAEFEALVSLAGYRFNHPENHLPHISSDLSAPLIAEGAYHPFIPQHKAVGNNFTLQSDQMALITGANMAGKSTFLRTIGLNYIMAASGLAVCAERFETPLFRLFTGMRTTDNLSRDISYFHAELLRLEQLIDYCTEHRHTLIILDEILKGTNSEDKLNGSRLFLKQMLRLNLRGMAATHDLGLSELENEEPRFPNYCFEIELNDQVTYSYKIERGVARNMNATFLLKQILEKRKDELRI